MSADHPSDAPTRDWKDTLFLPRTDFPMRAGLPKREPEQLARWEAIALERRMREAAEGRAPFELHDGPPYANGHLHIGHALNKILKDFVVRSRRMLGHDSRYVPGWDCHGLPIEWKVEEQYRARGQSKDAVPINALRAECRRFAARWVEVQREEFKRLGIGGAWEAPYLTMDFASEAAIAEEFLKFVMNGALYRGSKPVMWSVVEKTALAEAEVEYHDKQSPQVWVKFPVVAQRQLSTDASGLQRSLVSPEILERSDFAGASVLIWTTTPWTIPQNRAVCFNPDLAYGLYRVEDAPDDNWLRRGETVLLADRLAAEVFAAARVRGFSRIRDISTSRRYGPDNELRTLSCAHPLRGVAGAQSEWDYDIPLLPGEHVTDDAGTGFVHTAPSHGADDYAIGQRHGLEMTHNVLEDGAFRSDLPLFGGAVIFTAKGKEGDANRRVIEALREAGMLAASGRLTHAYPHSWRSKAPLIFRNTPQWFIALDHPLGDGLDQHGRTIRERALTSIDELVRWTPASGRNRLRSMIETRPDWVVSRQRAWGVPLSCFVHRETGELLRDPEVNAGIVAAFREEGADSWFAEGAKARFLGNRDPEEWEKVDDILDVWFESGSTHAFALEARGGRWPADVYLEGTDQHRGWFHSSLLEACGTRGRAPYRAVVTHGFTLDEAGQKMSKSLGNTVAPADVEKQYGADILRLWVATTDYTEDQRLGPNILKGVADGYRRLRNGFRFLLGALDGFEEAERVDPAEMPPLERWVLHRLAELDREVRAGYEAYAFQRVYQALFNFITGDLSALYFDVRKDALYCDPAGGLRRRACRTVLDLLHRRLTAWLAPILVFTMDEAWLSRFPSADGSAHLLTFPETPEGWLDPSLAERFQRLRRIRRAVLGALEVERRAGRIGASLEAAPAVHLEDPGLVEAAQGADLAELCITSSLTLPAAPAPAEAFRSPDAPGVAVVARPAEGEKCARCWRVLPEVGGGPRPALCGRCEAAAG